MPNGNPSSLRTLPSTNFFRSAPTAAAPFSPVLAPIQSEPEPSDRDNPPARETYREPTTQPVRRVSPSVNSSASTSTRSAPAEPTAAAPARTAVKYAAPLSATHQNVPPSVPSTSYRVVVESGYAASAQQVERNAFVRPDGQVQIGSYRDPNAAQQSLEQLRRQGIPARIE